MYIYIMYIYMYIYIISFCFILNQQIWFTVMISNYWRVYEHYYLSIYLSIYHI